MSDIKWKIKAMKNSSYIAWLGIAAAEYLDLGLTRGQLVYLYRECLEVARFQNDFDLNYYSCITLLPLIFDISAPPSTLEYYEASYKLAKVYGDDNLEMIVSLIMATEYMELHRFHDSILYAKRSLNIAKKIGDKSAEKRAYLILLEMNYALDRHDEVILYSKLCLSLVYPTEDDDRSIETCAYYHLGKAYYSLNQYDEAIFYSRKCVEVYQGADGTKHLAMNACLQLVYIYQSLNRHEDAIVFGKKSIEMSKQCNDKSVEMEAHLLLCTSYDESKKFNKCLLCTKEAIKAARITCNQQAEIAACFTRARTYNSLKQHDDVIIWGKKCVDLALINIFGRNYSGTKKMDKNGQILMSGSYLIMAEAHLNLEEYEDCIISSKKGITIARTLNDREVERQGYFFLGNAYNALHRYDECILYWEKCIEIAELTNSKNITMCVHKQLGQMYFDCLKKHHNAMWHFKKCLEYAKETGEASIEMLTNLEIAKIYYWFEDVDNAIRHIKKTLTAAEETGDKTIEAKAYLELGKCHCDLTKQYNDAILFTNKSIDVAKQIAHKIVEINAYLVLAKIYNQQGKHDDAITFNERCNDIAKEIGEQTLEMTGRCQIGKTYYYTNRYEEAIFHLNKCIAMVNGIDNKNVEMKAWFLLGKNYDKLQQYEEVVRCTERCIGIVLEPEEKNVKMEALLLSGCAYCCLNQYDDSIKNFYKCIDIAKNLGKTLTEMQAYYSLGNTFVRSGRSNDALVYGEKCLRIALEIGEKETEMDAYMLLGDVYSNLEKREDAKVYYNKCLDIAKKIGDKRIEMTAYDRIADTYLRMGKHDDAICHGNKALTIAQETGDREHEMVAYVTLGKAYLKKNMYDDAIQYSEKCLSTAQETNEEKSKKNASTEQGTTVGDIKGADDTIRYNPGRITLRAYLVLAQSYCSLNKRDDALICIQKCNNIRNEMNCKFDNKMIASLYLCKMYNSMEQFEDAIHYGKQCLELAIETGNIRFEQDSYFMLCDLCSKAKQWEDYLVYSKKCVQIVKEHGTKTNEIYALSHLGDAYMFLNEHKNAISTLKRCIQMAEGAGGEHSNFKMKAYLSLTISYNMLAKFKDSIGYSKICIDIAKKINEPLVELNALYVSANAFSCLNQYGEAYAHITEGLTIAHSLKNNFFINVFNTFLRMLYQDVGMTNEEIVCDTKLEADDIETEDDMKLNTRKFMVYFDRYFYQRSQKNYEEAIACLEDAMKAAVPNGKDSFFFFAKTMILKRDIAELYILQGQYDKGIQHYQEGLAVALNIDNKHHQAFFHFGLGEVYYVLKETEKAERSLRESIKCFEFIFSNIGNHDKFKIAIVDKYKNVHKMLLKVLIETNKNEEALVLADHFRALALKDILVSNYGMKEETAKGSLQYTDVQKLVSTNNYTILLFSLCLGEIYSFVLEAGEEYIVKYFEYSDNCFDKIIEKSYTEMKVREVVNCENRSLDALLEGEVKGDSLTNIRGPAEEQSEDSEDNSMTNASEIFYHRILPKFILEATPEEIVILPDGFLHEVPFAALQDPDTGRYLSETKRIRLAPSIATLKLLSENAGNYHSNEGALIIGDPLVGKVMFNGEETEFDPLIDAFCEALTVANLFRVTPLTRETATKTAVIQRLKQGVAVVHIAAHGSLTKGTIALAPSPEIRTAKIPDEEDYMLTMAEVQQAQVRAQLVVLSCCHSGRGEIRAEGVVGMCRAFLASGARAVVASLWAIDDEATLEFMCKFYLSLRDGKSASASLQQAMEEMRNTRHYSKPKDWAPFFLMGDDVTIKL